MPAPPFELNKDPVKPERKSEWDTVNEAFATHDIEAILRVIARLNAERKSHGKTGIGIDDAFTLGAPATLLMHVIDTKAGHVFPNPINAVRKLLEFGADPNAPGRGNSTAVHAAVNADSQEILEELRMQGGDLNRVSDAGTPLQWAIRHRKRHCMAYLLDQSASTVDIEKPDKKGFRALHYAVGTGDIETTKILIGKGASLSLGNSEGIAPYHLAAALHNSPMLDLLRTEMQKQKINLHPITSTSDKITSNGFEPIHIAAARFTDTASTLTTLTSFLPEHYTDEEENKLVEQSVRTIARDFQDLPTALNTPTRVGNNSIAHLAAMKDYDFMTRWSVDHGAHAAMKNAAGELPMHCAAKVDNPIAIMLAEKAKNGGFHIDEPDREDNTVLHHFARHGNIAAYKILRDKEGASEEAKNHEGDTPKQNMEEYWRRQVPIELHALTAPNIASAKCSLHDITDQQSCNKPTLIVFGGSYADNEKASTDMLLFAQAFLGRAHLFNPDLQLAAALYPCDEFYGAPSIIKKHNATPCALDQYENMARQFMAQQFLSLIAKKGTLDYLGDCHGEKRDLEEVKRNFSNLRILSHSFGTVVVEQIGNALVRAMQQIGYTPREIDETTREILLLDVAGVSSPDRCLANFTRVNIINNRDDIIPRRTDKLVGLRNKMPPEKITKGQNGNAQIAPFNIMTSDMKPHQVTVFCEEMGAIEGKKDRFYNTNYLGTWVGEQELHKPFEDDTSHILKTHLAPAPGKNRLIVPIIAHNVLVNALNNSIHNTSRNPFIPLPLPRVLMKIPESVRFEQSHKGYNGKTLSFAKMIDYETRINAAVIHSRS